MTAFLLTLIIIGYIFLAVMWWDMRRINKDIDFIYNHLAELSLQDLKRATKEFVEKHLQGE